MVLVVVAAKVVLQSTIGIGYGYISSSHCLYLLMFQAVRRLCTVANNNNKTKQLQQIFIAATQRIGAVATVRGSRVTQITVSLLACHCTMSKKKRISDKLAKPSKADKRREKEELAKSAAMQLFTHFYCQQYDKDRWSGLLQALKSPTRYCALRNKWAEAVSVDRVLGLATGESVAYLPTHLTNAYVRCADLTLNRLEEQKDNQVETIETIRDSVGKRSGDSSETMAKSCIADGEVDNSEETANGNGDDSDIKIFNFEATPDSAKVEAVKHGDGDGDGVDTEHDDDPTTNFNDSNSRWPRPGDPSSLDSMNLCCYYPLDAASLLPVELLKVEKDSNVLDMCAAPGGKSLAILQRLTERGSLTCTDVSPDRRQRLKNVLRRYLPELMLQQCLVAAGDGSSTNYCDKFGYRAFDRILVDAPCSSERHLLQDMTEMVKWKSGRSKANAERQIKLLHTAILSCRIGGRVVYSTCSLSTLENDGAVQKALKWVDKTRKKQVDAEWQALVVPIDPSTMPFGEPTELGWHILPDRSDGWGPIYLCVIDIVRSKTFCNVQKGESDHDN